MPEYLDPSIANEGFHAEKYTPGAWTDAPDVAAEEYQPDMEPPHINDYAAFKKSKQYAKYFRPYRYVPFPAFMYHPTLGEKIVKTVEEVTALGPEWSRVPFKPRVDMTGKSLPVKSDTQRLTEALIAGLTDKKAIGGGAVDANAIAAIVAATVAAMNQQAAPARTIPEPVAPPAAEHEDPAPEHDVERTALLELAEKEGIKIDKRWANARIKEALGLD